MRRPKKPAAPLAIPTVVYGQRRAGAVLPSLPEITEEELARRGDAADRLMQEIKRQIGEKASEGADKLPEPRRRR